MPESVSITLGFLLGALAADGLSGAVHWACDTWGDQRTRWLGPTLIHAFREHHRDPRAMLEHGWVEVNREPLAAAAIALAVLCLPASRALLEGRVFVQAFLFAFIGFGAAANQLHQWAHSSEPPPPVAWLQRMGWVLSPERHADHHCSPNTTAYCISIGWLNAPLDALGFWRGLEAAITRLTGAQPRAADAEPVKLVE
jgi:ubiquitin-conjugating enzyme E2 variant